MENTSITDSQVLDSSCSLSLSSELPDIGNWFSSYVYESPELNSIGNCEHSISRIKEIGEDELIADVNDGEKFGGFRAVRKASEEVAAEKHSRTCVPKCASPERNREIQPFGNNQDSWSSQSLLSEPPDIRNWFSSYVYESPTLSSSQDLGDDESDDSEFIVEAINNKKEEALKNSDRPQIECEGIVDEKVCLKAFVKFTGSSGDIRLEEQSVDEVNAKLWRDDPSSQQNLFSERTWKRNPKVKIFGIKEKSPTKNVQILSLTNRGSQCNQQEKATEETSSPRLHENGSSNNVIRKSEIPTNITDSINLMQTSPQTEVQTHVDCSSPARNAPSVLTTNGQSTRKSTNPCSNKENIETRIQMNGFITANKHKFPGESFKRSVEMPENYNKGIGCAAALPKRKVFLDKSNIEDPNMIGVTGKWRCPQKTKPNLGPPLKQLRLERWVRKE